MADRTDPLPPTIPAPQVTDALRRNWWLMLILGVLLILGGIAAIVLPVVASLAVTIAVGAALTVAGVFKFAHAFRCGGWRCRGWSLLSAALYVIGGVLLLFNPLAGMISLTILMIALIGADGVLRTVVAFRMRPEAGWGWMLAGGIAGVLLAILMMVMLPWIGLTALGVLAGIALIFEGWGFVAVALASRRGDHGVGRHAHP
ncbi:MAG TPA: HdeD family acid-resistance protein [Paracoccaceae bacterium]|nr:HdeD family acid-resistance protein [Paracoccaceae bacterium]